MQPTFDMGYQAVEVLLRRIEKGEAKKPREKVRLPATLTVRESFNTPCSVAAKSKLRGGLRLRPASFLVCILISPPASNRMPNLLPR